MTNHKDDTLNIGLSLLYEFFEIFSFYFDNYMENKSQIKDLIYSEIENSIKNNIKMHETYRDILDILKKNKGKNISQNEKIKFDEFFDLRSKRLNSFIFMLMDIGFSEDEYRKELLDSVMVLGRYTEINGTLLRDYSRYLVIFLFNL